MTTGPGLSVPRAVLFDLGDTLLEYEGLPLSWEQHYRSALEVLAAELKVAASEAGYEQACAVLRRYNTRLNPREAEVTFATICGGVCAAWGVSPDVSDELRCARAFFRVFQQRVRAFPDARPTLERLRGRGVRIGVFTDVPYGMPRELVIADLRAAGLQDSFDVLVTSRDAGLRKPAPGALAGVASALGCGSGEVAYVGNERKDVEAARAFGCTSVLLCRQGATPAWGQQRTITSLSEL